MFILKTLEDIISINEPILDSDKAKELRIRAGYRTQTELARELGIHQVYINEVERGKRKFTRKKVKSEKSLLYFSWLKGQGYNPLNL